MHELTVNCLYLLAIILSVLGSTAVILILIGVIKGTVDIISRHDDE